MAENLVLYIRPNCPYCVKVGYYMQKNGINIETRSIEDQEHMLYLVSNGGKRQVPCLFIDGKPLYESEDIIDYLAQCFGVG